MKIIYDHPLFSFRYGGAPRYFAELMANIPRENWENTTLLNFNQDLAGLNLMKLHHFKFRGEYALTRGINKCYTYLRLMHRDYDVFHQTNYDTYLLSAIGNKPMVTTYHDSNFSTYYYDPKVVEKQRVSIERANAVIVVSNNTKKDLLNIFHTDESKVHVIYHGINLPTDRDMSSPALFDFPYILYVGRRSEYKNFRPFAKAFKEVQKAYPDLKLICTGGAFSKEELDYLDSIGLSNESSIKAVFVDDKQLRILYRDAKMFVFPSKYEGFGMPILEAWSCHCPVVLAHASCFPEIAKDAAVYFDPNSLEEMKESMIRVLDDSELRNTLIKKGDEYVKHFSWKKCADEHLKIYQSLL
jgi:glycosyltransferase involved in cell wall biosynthesis